MAPASTVIRPPTWKRIVPPVIAAAMILPGLALAQPADDAAKCQAADSNTNELQHGVPDRFAHPAHLPVLTLGDIQFKPRVLIRPADFPDDRAPCHLAAANIQSVGELEIFIHRHDTGDLGRHHAHVSRGNERIFSAGNVATHRVNGDVLVAENDSG